ncbi:helix-turn-helix domain-containing protein [Nostoc sp. CHAB 5715]|uniref:winged helix-turn-helix transcriptional regulator n=1 Tax=Nostoc sp. CHAB 5715 TaxID=2780400 RepID=UPI001E341452|nr:winged helix-turn-helix transcriptional regulator [Nostoc sp. CHAB 5715]MCC5621374.1 winged helix-turn-helix transcriptional regulator [Nostoc sp. CHAB 5715]
MAIAFVLIQQLRELESDNIVARTVYSEVPPKVEYSFTDYGRNLEPVLHALCDWGEAHLSRNNRHKDGSVSPTTATDF